MVKIKFLEQIFCITKCNLKIHMFKYALTINRITKEILKCSKKSLLEIQSKSLSFQCPHV